MDGIKDEVDTEDENNNNDECCPEKIISNHIKPNKEKEKGNAEAIIVKVKSPSNLKRKTNHHLGVVSGVEGEVVRDEICNIDEDKTISQKKIKPNEELKKEEDEISDEKVKSPLDEKRSEHLQENVQGVEQTTPDGAKKGPSRSAIRKKAKRQRTKISQKMEGFVLPLSESTRILKDMEVLCVKREEMDLTEATEETDSGNLVDYVKVNMKEHVNNYMLLLPKEELEDESSFVEIVSKKRKASTILLTPKSEHLQENVKEFEQTSTALDGAKKGPSRSARRKKAKKQRKQELAKISQKMEGFVLPYSESTRILKEKEVICVKREEMALDKAIEEADACNLVDYVKVNMKEPVNNDMLLLPKEELEDESSPITASTSSKSLKSEHLQVNVEGVEQASTEPDEAKKVLSRSARRKKAKRQWKRELAKISLNMEGFVLPYSESTRILKDMEVLCVKREAIEGADAGNLVDYAEVNRKESVKNEPLQENVEGVEQASTALDGAKKVLSRSARRKKAKKQRKQELAKIISQKSKAENKEANDVHPKGLVIDFDKLPLCTSPKERDVIAYRVVELSSSWIPHLSTFRVGKISHFNAKNIILNPVAEYPIVFDKMDEDGPDNYSLYEEDGSLEIKFAGLVDVRSVKQSNDTNLTEIKIESGIKA